MTSKTAKPPDNSSKSSAGHREAAQLVYAALTWGAAAATRSALRWGLRNLIINSLRAM
jgi:hypothetical protein